MKARILLALFALPFAGIGVWMLWSNVSMVTESVQMRDWVATEARLFNAGYNTSSGGDSTTYEAYAKYSYTFNGQPFTGNRVTLKSGYDNIGGYQADMGRELSSAWNAGRPITVYVNPEQPSSSIIDRDFRWSLIGFNSIFVLVFGGIGFGMLYASSRPSKEKDASLPEYQQQPWLLNDDWQTPTLHSNSKATMWFAWGFAGFWNALSAAVPFMVHPEIVERKNYLAAVGLLFPVIGIGLIIWAISRTREWRRIGPAPLTMDPFPGSIGGHVGGTIELNLPFDPAIRYQLSLSNIHKRVSRNRGKTSSNESAKWQDKLVAHAESSGTGTRLTFRFDVPEELHESDAQPEGKSHYSWRLTLKAKRDDVTINRDYEIPVYATAEVSRHVSDRAVNNAKSEQHNLDMAAVLETIQYSEDVNGKRLLYPAGRHIGFGIGGVLFGAIATGIGGFLLVKEHQYIIGGVFSVIGPMLILGALYMALNSLEVVQNTTSIRTVRRLLGIAIKRREISRNAFHHFDKKSTMQSSSGSTHTIYYSIYAVDDDGNKLVLGEGFKGDNEARAAIALFEERLGLKPKQPTPSDAADYDILAADS